MTLRRESAMTKLMSTTMTVLLALAGVSAAWPEAAVSLRRILPQVTRAEPFVMPARAANFS